MVPQDPISKRAEEERRMVSVREVDDTPVMFYLLCVFAKLDATEMLLKRQFDVYTIGAYTV